MALTLVVRTLRDGALVIKDGAGSPHSCTVVCDNGDLRWTETKEWRMVKCRGTNDHVRPGDDVELEMSCTFKWMHLLGYTGDSSDPIQPYEMINDEDESHFTSVASGYYALLWEFTVTDPEGVTSEKIAFPKMRKVSLECAEGDEFNTIAFSGRDINTTPTVTQV